MIAICPDAQSPDIEVVCPPEPTLRLIEPVARFNPPDVLPFTGWEFLLIGVGAAVAVLIGLAVIWVVSDRRKEERP